MSTTNTDIEDAEIINEANDISKQLEEQTKESIKNFIAEATKEGICSLSMYELKENYPKAYDNFLAYLATKFPSGSEVFDENNQLAEDYIVSVLLYNPLPPVMNFLDNSKQFLNVKGKETTWSYSLNDIVNPEAFESRTLAQIAGIKACFAALEQTL